MSFQLNKAATSGKRDLDRDIAAFFIMQSIFFGGELLQSKKITLHGLSATEDGMTVTQICCT